MTDHSLLRPRRALISVSDKTGLVELGRALADADVVLLSTGGSAAALRQGGLAVTDVAEHTGFPEMMEGRLKTLHPLIHGGILGRPADADAMSRHGIAPIDLVIVNLYPFEATVARGADFETAIENIDIGGPAMIRAAVKNHERVAVVTDPADYDALLAAIAAGGTDLTLRRRLAARAIAHTATYDGVIANWFARVINADLLAGEAPRDLALSGHLQQRLRYGENPHQAAALYRGGPARPGVASAKQLQGKELSYNNLNDTDAAYELVAEFAEPAAVIVKHASPCGVAIGASLEAAYARALACDPVSAFGGVIALNRPLDAATARLVAGLFAEVVIAPEIEAEALAVLADKKNLRVLAAGALPDPAAPGLLARSIAGGWLVQARDGARVSRSGFSVVTKRAPTETEAADLVLAMTVAKHVKSNAIVLARNGATVGIGGGQTSRVAAAAQAVAQAAAMAEAAGEATSRAIGAVVGSDAFFPFPDGLEVCLRAGVTAAAQPGGAQRDAAVIEAADAAGAAMVFTGARHFRH